MPGFDGTAARFLTLRYVVALAVVAALTLAAQVAVQIAIARQRADAATINTAGRQRMLSQRLVKASLAWHHAEDDVVDRPERARERAQVLAEWTVAHRQLVDAANTPVVTELLAAVEPHHLAMVAAAVDIERDRSSLGRLLEGERAFLPAMERVVAAYQDEAAARVRALGRLEAWLCAALIVVLILEVLLVFRPSVRRLRQAIRDRERLHEQEAANRELASAAAAARAIGQDLHDGLGQTLTALSLQVGALERRLDGANAEACVALREHIGAAIGQTRALAHRLAPTDAARGLEPALAGLCATIRRGGIDCTLTWRGPEPPSTVAVEAWRIAQEAVTNAVRHGKAGRIALGAGALGDAWELSVVDDGVGGAMDADGFGLRTMRARAHALGGTLAAGPGADGGWTVRLRLAAMGAAA